MRDKIMPAADDSPPDEKEFVSLFQQIQDMAVSDKIKLASLGNKEARNLLIKDGNKLIVQAVINSPKISDDEIAQHAGNRNLSKEVARLISSKKEFLKSYKIKLALVNNPKTALPVAMKLLLQLREPDLRKISKSKNVPALLARTAMRTLSTRGRA
ncbi:MAG: hypothetical protein GY868_00605 [Deltaproteobacteria bacterium]|nr:hypothetical protein [Deltaproteobacteria bacterium]